MISIIARHCVVVWLAGLCSIPTREGRRASLGLAGLPHCQSVDGPTLNSKNKGAIHVLSVAALYPMLLSSTTGSSQIWFRPNWYQGRVVQLKGHEDLKSRRGDPVSGFFSWTTLSNSAVPPGPAHTAGKP